MTVNGLLQQYSEWMLEDRLRHATMVFCGYAKDMLEPIEQLLTYSFREQERQTWLDAFQTLRTNVAKLDHVADYDDEKYVHLIKQLRQEGASLRILNHIQREHQRFLDVMTKELLAPLYEPLERLASLADFDFEELQASEVIRRFSYKPIEIIDQFDYFSESLSGTSIKAATLAQLTLLIAQLIEQLAHFNVYELDVLHKELDGEYMVSIGAMPRSLAPDVARHHVCKVFERGFYIKETNDVLREAKVMTVM